MQLPDEIIMRTFAVATLPFAFLLFAGQAVAGHANPWATPEDEVLMQYHDENLVQSEGTPGHDEMLGAMNQDARGKLDTSMDDVRDRMDAAGDRMGAGHGGRGR